MKILRYSYLLAVYVLDITLICGVDFQLALRRYIFQVVAQPPSIFSWIDRVRWSGETGTRAAATLGLQPMSWKWNVRRLIGEDETLCDRSTVLTEG